VRGRLFRVKKGILLFKQHFRGFNSLSPLNLIFVSGTLSGNSLYVHHQSQDFYNFNNNFIVPRSCSTHFTVIHYFYIAFEGQFEVFVLMGRRSNSKSLYIHINTLRTGDADLPF